MYKIIMTIDCIQAEKQKVVRLVPYVFRDPSVFSYLMSDGKATMSQPKHEWIVNE